MSKIPVRPLLFVYELTQSCNSNCSFCYNVWKKPEGEYPQATSLSISQRETLIPKLIAECKEAKLPIGGFALAGGEPLLDKEWLQTAQLLRSEGIPVNLATNGILLSEEKIRELQKIRINQVEISLPATTKASYKSLTDSEHVAQVRSNILLLKEMYPEVTLTIAITITKENLTEIDQSIDIATAFSADSIVLNRFIPTGAGLKNAENLTPSIADLKEVLSTANEKSRHLCIPITVTLPIEDCLLPHEQFPQLRFGTCTCGENKWVIDPAGHLRICEQNPHILGNLLEEPFHQLRQSIQVENFRMQNQKAECSACKKYAHCGGGCRFAS